MFAWQIVGVQVDEDEMDVASSWEGAEVVLIDILSLPLIIARIQEPSF
jgi:hypothetical protein